MCLWTTCFNTNRWRSYVFKWNREMSSIQPSVFAYLQTVWTLQCVLMKESFAHVCTVLWIMHWMHLSSTLYIIETFLSVALMFWPVLCETVFFYTPNNFMVSFIFAVLLSKQLRNSMKTEHVPSMYGFSTLKNFEVYCLILILNIPHRRCNVLSLPATNPLLVWTYPVTLKWPEKQAFKAQHFPWGWYFFSFLFYR